MISWPSVRLNTRGAPRCACIFLSKWLPAPKASGRLVLVCCSHECTKINPSIISICFWLPFFASSWWFKLFVCRLCSHFIQECFGVIFWKGGIMLLAVGEGGGGARTPSEYCRSTREQGSEPPYGLKEPIVVPCLRLYAARTLLLTPGGKNGS